MAAVSIDIEIGHIIIIMKVLVLYNHLKLL